MELGLLTLMDLLPDPSGMQISPAERMREIIEQAVLAENAGLYSVVVGEHHADPFIGTTPSVVMAAMAARTNRIRLRSGVTLVPTADCVNLAEEYATADVISDGRVEICIGKGTHTEPFQLWGPDFEHVEEALQEKTDLLTRLLTETDVHWQGQFRRPIDGYTTRPRPLGLPLWWGLGRSLESAKQAAKRGLPLMGANVMEHPDDLLPRISAYRETWAQEGHEPAGARLAMVGQLHVARTSQEARKRWRPYYENYYARNAVYAKKSLAIKIDLSFDFDERIAPVSGAAICGSPAEVAERIIELYEVWHHDEHAWQLDLGGLPFDVLAETIELLGSEVLPQVKSAIADDRPTSEPILTTRPLPKAVEHAG